MAIYQREEACRYQLLIKQIQQQKGNNALDDLQHLFSDKIKKLKHQYPALTETDIQVVTLIGLGVSNTDILQLADMSKRTYYKRRQLIAQRMNTTAAQLDQIAQNAFATKTK
jgi:FixJ family two-component response regulator